MNPKLTAHLGELVATLHDLRRRFREAARIEVARAIGEALSEFARATICGPARYSSMPRSTYSTWEDSDHWRDADEDPWHSRHTYAREVAMDNANPHDLLMLPPALVAGFGAARWCFAKTRQIGPAIVIGLIVALGAYAGGPSVKALIETWSTANDLLNYPGPERRS
jgi:hypothetical protein